MTWGAPWVLVALVIVVPGAIVLWRSAEGGRRRALDAFGDPAVLDRSSRWPSRERRRVAGGVLLAGVVLGVVALARPQFGGASHGVERQGGDVLFLLDLSRSMTATDAEPTRLGAAKRAIEAIARAVPNDRVGLLVFGGSGFVALPPTVDRSTFQLFVDAAQPSDIPDISTNLEAAAGMAAEAVTQVGTGAGSTAIVVVSDGEDVEGKLEGAIKALNAAHVRTSAVGIGTVGGTTILDRDSVSGGVAPHHDWAGNVVTTRLMEDNLEDIARRTGGVYARWDGDAASVRPVVAALGALEARAVSGQAHEAAADRYQWVLVVAIVLLLLEPLVVGV
jgi:Ca-activated chloride channel homolog